MAIVSTILAAACGVGDTKITVASAAGFNVGNLVLVESELMQQTGPAAGVVVPVRRGLDGCAQVTHANRAFATTGLGTDFPSPAPGQNVVYGPYAPDGQMGGYYTYNIAGAIAVAPGVHTINGTGVTAMTLAGPTGPMEGAVMVIESKNLHANTVTALPIFLGAANAGGIGTFAATGGNILLKACGEKWTVIGSSGVAFT